MIENFAMISKYKMAALYSQTRSIWILDFKKNIPTRIVNEAD